MKNRKIRKLLLLLLCLIAVVAIILFSYEKKRKKEEWVQQKLLAIDYREQNEALPRVSGRPYKEEYYVGYDAIDETELYVRLIVYSEWIQENGGEAQELTIEDIKDYLADEYNEDGSYRIQEGYENIWAYVDWYFAYGGADDIREYWSDLEIILMRYREQNPGIIDSITGDMNIVQLKELINKKNNPAYEINMEVLKGEDK